MSKKKSPNSVFDVYASAGSVSKKFCSELVVEDVGVPNLDAGGVEFGVDGGVEFGVDGGVEFGVDLGAVRGHGSDMYASHFFSNVTELIVQLIGFP